MVMAFVEICGQRKLSRKNLLWRLFVGVVLIAIIMGIFTMREITHRSEAALTSMEQRMNQPIQSFSANTKGVEEKNENINEDPKSSILKNDDGRMVVTVSRFTAADDSLAHMEEWERSQNEISKARLIRNPLFDISPHTQRLPLTRNVTKLGVLLDAGRHYYPLEWIHNLLDMLHMMGFNLLHFRLTDDQAFNIRLKSHPELSTPVCCSNNERDGNVTNSVYTPEELRELVDHAHKKGIVIMPEINVPGHAAGWAGQIPYLVAPCPHFVCSHGYGLPLNTSHPKLPTLLRNIIQEVRGIFHTSPYLHLGGDEVAMGIECWDEMLHDENDMLAAMRQFELMLKGILKDLNVSEDYIVRWEPSSVQLFQMKEFNYTRAGAIEHFWISRNYQQPRQSGYPFQPVFVSNELYFDTNENDDGWDVFGKTRTLSNHQHAPIAIIAGTFELGVDYWMDRNVLGRLIAVAMGASNETYQHVSDFENRYSWYCRLLDLPNETCTLMGRPPVGYHDWRLDWKETTTKWKQAMCERLTLEIESPRAMRLQRKESFTALAAIRVFWDNFPNPPGSILPWNDQSVAPFPRSSGEPLPSLKPIQDHGVPHTGIILDLVEVPKFTEELVRRIFKIINYIAKLGFNLLQLRIMSNYGFAVALESVTDLHFGLLGAEAAPFPTSAIRVIVMYAATRGIRVLPEITVAHRAGGWYHATHVVPCPRHHCRTGSFALVMDEPNAIPVVLAVVRELRALFTSPFIHLGFDDREESTECYQESGMAYNFDRFESKLELALKTIGIPSDTVLRYDNKENKVYKRAGAITHYHYNNAPKGLTEPFFVSLDLYDAQNAPEDGWEVYQRARSLQELQPTGVMAVVNVMNDQLMKKLNLRQRLLAMAIGLSKQPHSRNEFETLFNTTCVDLANADCELLGRLRSQPKAQAQQTMRSNWQLETSCQLRVDLNHIKRISKPGVV